MIQQITFTLTIKESKLRLVLIRKKIVSIVLNFWHNQLRDYLHFFINHIVQKFDLIINHIVTAIFDLLFTFQGVTSHHCIHEIFNKQNITTCVFVVVFCFCALKKSNQANKTKQKHIHI